LKSTASTSVEPTQKKKRRKEPTDDPGRHSTEATTTRLCAFPMKREAEVDSSESADKISKTMAANHGADQETAFISPSSARYVHIITPI
jgi:hypothetical protein